ncbi:MAG: alpha/beta hydrolase [Vicinamibacterales bacterium]|nr:alpha/beta hydrolase [Vicinamibacterales bacterium]
MSARRTAALALTLALSLPSAALAQAPRVMLDIPYVQGSLSPNQTLDLYLPDTPTRFPVVVVVFGGGLRQGDKKEEAAIGRRLAADGLGAVVINYRLSPGVEHPAHVQDLAAAIAWTKRTIGEHGGDPDRTFVLGWSAGAYLAALVALDGQYLSAHQLTPAALRGVVPISGFHHVERVAPDRPKDTWGADPSTWPKASSAAYARKDAPPFLLLYADGDAPDRKQESRDLAAALTATGHTSVRTQEISGRNHTTIWRNLANEGDAALAAIAAFVRGTGTR